MNDLLTAYLRTLCTLRGGQMSPAQGMDRLIDFIDAAQGAKTTLGNLLKSQPHDPSSRRDQHA